MATLVSKVRALTGSTTSVSANTMVVEFLNDSASFLLSHIPKELLKPYSSEGTVTNSSGFSHSNNVVLGCRRGIYTSIEADPRIAPWLESSSGSLHLPTTQFPRHYERGGKIYIKPNPTTDIIGYVDYIPLPTLTTSSSNVFGNLEHIVIDNAAGYDYKAMGRYWLEQGVTLLGTSLSISTILSQLTTNVPTWSAVATPTLSSLVMPTISTLPAGPSMPTVPTISTSISIPATPSWPTEPSFTTSISMPSFPTLVGTSQLSLSLPTSYTLPMLSLTAAPGIGSITLSTDVTLPDAPSISIVYDDVYSELADPINDWSFSASLPTLSVPATYSFVFTGLNSALSHAEDFIMAAQTIESVTAHSAGYWINSEDSEMARTAVESAAQELSRAKGELEKEMSNLQRNQIDIQKEFERFSGELNKYKTEVDKEVQKNTLRIQDYNARVQERLNDLNEQIAKTNADISKYQANSQALLGKYSNEANADISKFQAETSAELEEWKSKVLSEIDEYKSKADVFISDYSTRAQTGISEFDSRNNVLINAYRAEVEGVISEYRALNENKASIYIATVNGLVGQYGAEVRAVVEQYVAETSAKVNLYSSEVSAVLGEYSAKVDAFVSHFTAEYSAALGEYSAKANAEIGLYSAEVQYESNRFSSLLNSAISLLKEAELKIAEYQSKIQHAQQYFSKSQILNAEGDKMFLLAQTKIDNFVKYQLGNMGMEA